jgi:hypothetical protein
MNEIRSKKRKGPDAEEENFDINELPTHLN